MGRLQDFRNAPMHSRPLLPFERDLLAGIAGEIRNSFTLWRSEHAPDMTFYPSIDSVVDSFGNLIPANAPNKNVLLSTRLQVGDVVSFRCTGTDPQGRDLTWMLAPFSALGKEIDRQIGPDVTLTWSVSEDDIGEPSILALTLISAGKYHRQSWGDVRINLFYAVEPPVTSTETASV
jgi:hypothetical protein